MLKCKGDLKCCRTFLCTSVLGFTTSDLKKKSTSLLITSWPCYLWKIWLILIAEIIIFLSFCCPSPLSQINDMEAWKREKWCTKKKCYHWEVSLGGKFPLVLHYQTLDWLAIYGKLPSNLILFFLNLCKQEKLNFVLWLLFM